MMSKIVREQILNLYSMGLSIKAVSSELAIPFGTVYDNIRKAGINRSRENALLRHDFFHTIDTEFKSYWLGFLTADGCVQYDIDQYRYEIALSLHRKDKKHIKKFAKSLNSNCCISDIDSISSFGISRMSSIHICSKQMVVDLIEKGVIPNKTHYCIPYITSTNLQHHYWRGMVDGDGYITKSKRGYHTVGLVGTLDMCLGFRDYCRNFVTTKKNPSLKKNTKSTFQITLTNKAARTIISILYQNSNISLDRKYRRYKRYAKEFT